MRGNGVKAAETVMLGFQKDHSDDLTRLYKLEAQWRLEETEQEPTGGRNKPHVLGVHRDTTGSPPAAVLTDLLSS